MSESLTTTPSYGYLALRKEAERRGLRLPTPSTQEKVRREANQAEWEKCRDDVCYWFSKYCQSYDSREADTGNAYSPFILFPVQIRFLHWLDDRIKAREGGVVEKSRDSGASYLCVGFALHHWLFQPGFAAGFGSRKGDYVDKLGDPKSLFEKLRMLYRGMPEWMQPAGFSWTKHAGECRLVNPANGATITGESGDGVGRGGRTSIYFVDEAAYLEHPQLADASLSQNTNVRIDVSTPNGLDDFYTKTRSGRVKVFRLHWIDDSRKNRWEEQDAHGNIVYSGVGRHPTAPIPNAFERPFEQNGLTVCYPWYERERIRPEYIDPSVMAQEIDIDYIGSGRPRFNRKWLISLREEIWPNNEYAADWGPEWVEEPGAWAGTATTFVDPVPRHSYAICADTARGLTLSGTADYSVAHVFDLETAEQVCHYRGQMSEIDFATDLDALGRIYNNALIVVETPGPGEAVLSMLHQSHYPNVYSYWDDDGSGRVTGRFGLPMTATTKPEGDGKLASMLQDAERDMPGAMVIRHPNTIEECVHYVRLRGDTCGAEAGAHDDEVAALRLFAMVWPSYQRRGRKYDETKKEFRPKVSSASRLIRA